MCTKTTNNETKSVFKLPNGRYTTDLETYFTQCERDACIQFIDRFNSPFSGIRKQTDITVHRYTYRYKKQDSGINYEEKTITIEEIIFP